jgi:CAF1 family ribonuclease
VTRHNFDESLPLIQKALADCKFFAFDCEFTGLRVADSALRPSKYDEIEDRYDQVCIRKFANAFARIRGFESLSCFGWPQTSLLSLAWMVNICL